MCPKAGDRLGMTRPALQFKAQTKAALRALKTHGPSQLQFWFIALAIGIAAGFAALFFRLGIDWIQGYLYGTDIG